MTGFSSEQPQFVDITFDGPPGPIAGRFVECETPDGRSCKFGEWIDRNDGTWALRVYPGDFKTAVLN